MLEAMTDISRTPLRPTLPAMAPLASESEGGESGQPDDAAAGLPEVDERPDGPG